MTTFRKANLFNKIDETGAVVGAFVYLTDPVTNDTISAVLEGDHRQTSEPALVELVLEAFFKRHYAERAAAEAVQRLTEEVSDLRAAQKAADKKQAALVKQIKDLEATVVNLRAVQPKVAHEAEIEE